MFENLVRAWVDWRIERRGVDDGVPGPPQKYLDELEKNMHAIQPAKRLEAIEIIKAGANLYHNKRHHEAVPPEIQKRVAGLEVEAKRAVEIDKSEAVLERYGSVEEAIASFMSEARGERRSLALSEPVVKQAVSVKNGRGVEESGVIRNHTSRQEGESLAV